MSLAASIKQHLSQQATATGGSAYPTLMFGKHKGLPIDQIETGYLKWCVSGVCTIVESKPFLKSEIQRCLDERANGIPVQTPLPSESEPLNNSDGEQRLLDQIRQLRRQLKESDDNAEYHKREMLKAREALHNSTREDLRQENADLREEVRAMRQARASTAGSDAKSWWAKNKKRLAFLAHPDRNSGQDELMRMLNQLNNLLREPK